MTQFHNGHPVHRLGHRRRTGLGSQFARIGAACALAAAIGTGGAAHAADITGTNGADTIIGTPDADNIQALGGSDTVSARGGNDRIQGGDGNDTLSGEEGDDGIVSGGKGSDQISGGLGRDRLLGDAGNDTLDGGDGNDPTLAGGDGNDMVLGGAGNDDVDGDDGNDTLRGGTGGDDMFGLDGSDGMFGEDGGDELFGGEGADTLSGGAGADELEGEEAADRIEGGADDDQLNFFTSAFQPDSTFAVRDVVLDFQGAGAPGGDVLRLSGGEFAWVGRIAGSPKIGAVLPGGGDGLTQLGYIQRSGTFLVADTNDDGRLDAEDFTVEFRGALDFTTEDFENTDFIIAGTNGDDTITGTEGDDRIFAAGGNDSVTALGGNDEVHGGTGDDSLDGGPGGFDDLLGEEGNDQLTLATSDGGGNASGGDGDDVLFGSDTSFSNFDNVLDGDAGHDDLHAGAVGSTLNGGSGADRLSINVADDQFDAGRDDLTFELDNAPDLLVYSGTGRWSHEDSFSGDTVFSFQDGSDLFDLRGSGLQFSDLTIVNDDFQTTITSDRGQITIFENLGEEVFVDANDFLF
jgi:Ca2+-binding RTX toxin-like protein